MNEPLLEALPHWESFYLLTGTAAATLIGLMFVVVTFGAGGISKKNLPIVRRFVDTILLHFVWTLLIAGVLLMPLLHFQWVGGLLVLLGLFRLNGWLRSYQFLRNDSSMEPLDWLFYAITPFVSHVLLLASGVALYMGSSLGLTGLGIVSLLLLATGIQNAWDTVILIAVQETKEDKPA